MTPTSPQHGQQHSPRTHAEILEKTWKTEDEERWRGIRRNYSAGEVVRLRGSLPIEHTLSRHGAQKLWRAMKEEPFVNALGALTGNQAMQQVKAGLKAIYLSGWQVAADANNAGQMYPDQSLYPASSVPDVVRRINQTLRRADQIQHSEGKGDIDYFVPIVADAEAGFGGPLNAFELMKAMIEAGAAGVHFEDQLASEKKCGHLGGKVLIPTQAHIRNLDAARLAADVCGVPTVPWSTAIEPRLQTAVSSGPVLSVISVHRLEECTTPAWSWGLRTLQGSLNVSQGWPVSKSMRSITFHSSSAGRRSPWSSPASTCASYSA